MAKPNRGITVQGGDGDDVIPGTSGNDSLGGGGGNDTIDGSDGADRINGHAGDDLLMGGAGDDTIAGNEGNDTLFGGDGDDFLAGQEGSDTVDGEAGNDTLGWGGFGTEVLAGGSGSDTFYSGAWEWTNQQVGEVLITDFESGLDTLDLTRIDADESTAPGVIRGKNTPGNEAFTVVTETDGVTAGHLVIANGYDGQGQPITLVLGYTDTELGADIQVQLSGHNAIAPSDILL